MFNLGEFHGSSMAVFVATLADTTRMAVGGSFAT